MTGKKTTKQTEITLKKLAEIKPYDKNPRDNEAAVQLVSNSIKEFGFKVPIVIDKAGVIVCGHTRYKAAHLLGLGEVPCIVADDLTPAQIRAYRLADNKVAEASQWDFEKLADELAGLADFDMEAFGFGEVGDIEPDVEEEYKDMPECKNENQLAIEITIRFKTIEEKIAFGELIGQKITDKTKALRHPKECQDQLGTKEGLTYE
ncbi:ParB N-terminal domain-containing protein [Candidatus Pacearchaeota archaeon]|jgi:hypothetical protein|nr:ParB N-terminal domain-containing protein [Candidatus Pacearchaeota archaeon]